MIHQEPGVPFNFVVGCSDADLATYARLPSVAGRAETDPDFAAALSSQGELIWCLQGFLVLANRTSLDVRLSNRLVDGAVNIVHSDRLLLLRGDPKKFLLCVRADYPMRRWAHFHFVQNRVQLATNTAYVPHWVQWGLLRRGPERRGVHRVGYVGHLYNGNFAGTVEWWQRQLAHHGIEFVTPAPEAWRDMRSLDVVIGIRSFDRKPHNSKPPSKLLNAWHARVPFVGGHDSAFRQVGSPGEDYLLVETPQEALAAVLRLRDEPALYNRLVRHGAHQAARYTEATICAVWQEALTGPVMHRYDAWRASPTVERARFKALLAAALLERDAKRQVSQLLARRPAA